ncbi:hypothetical protein EAE96_010984 [Botrytis aclada]|nr:hypothetical protein EAE96_010984 [Botrytis aclada]
MEHQGDKTTNEIINFAPDGDIILVFGPEMKRFRVHSLFLKLASKPFLAMSKPEWQEGQSLLRQNGPEEIELPADNATALETILAIVHHRKHEIPEDISASQVLEFAVTADKYDFLDAIYLASNTLLRCDRRDAIDQMRLAAAAYLFRNARAFREITKTLVLNWRGGYYNLACDEVESVMGWKVFCLLEAQRTHALTGLSEILLAGINDCHAKCHLKCGWTSKHAYAYMKLLERKTLWPIGLHKTSVYGAIEAVRDMPEPVVEEASDVCREAWNHKPPRYRDGRSERFKSLCEKTGLCLSCVRAGYECYCGMRTKRSLGLN